MTRDWPSNGYTGPRKYEINERRIYFIALILITLFGVSVFSAIIRGVDVYLELWEGFAASIGLSNFVVVRIGAAATIFIGLYVMFELFIIPVHEGLHYGMGLLLNLNPDFGYDEGRILSNPRVVALSTGIPVWKNLAMILAPFVILALSSWGVMQITGGLVRGIAAFILLVNSAASAQDLYHYCRLVQMDPGAKFANFEEDGEIHTEYALPE